MPQTQEQLAAHLAAPVAINIATRGPELNPHIVRAIGAGLTAENEITVYVPKAMSTELVANLEQNGFIAMNAGNVTNYQTLQFKGKSIRIAEGDRTEAARFAAQRAATTAVIGQYFGPGPQKAWESVPMDATLAITFQVTDIFQQTPAPGTGGKLS